MRSFGVSWIPYSGITLRVSALVGQSLGAHRCTRPKRVVRRGQWSAPPSACLFCLLYRATASDIIRAFDHEPEVVIAGTSFLQMIALGWLFSGPMLPMAQRHERRRRH